ncbi:hypothetical protein HDU76_009028, partial [Blyttiomyces sp. JEL0837]
AIIQEYFVANVSLWSEDGQTPIIYSDRIPARMRVLVGNTFATATYLKDDQGRP